VNRLASGTVSKELHYRAIYVFGLVLLPVPLFYHYDPVSHILQLTMASDFIGDTILVTLRNPPNAQVQGVVANVVNQTLYLQHGMAGDMSPKGVTNSRQSCSFGAASDSLPTP